MGFFNEFHCVIAGCPFLVVRLIGQETQNAGLKIHKRVWKDNSKKFEKPIKETQRDARKSWQSRTKKNWKIKKFIAKVLKWKTGLKKDPITSYS